MSQQGMKKKLLTYLEEKQRALYLMLRIFQVRKNPVALQKYYDYQTNPNFIRLEKNENATIQDTVLLVETGDGKAGLFAHVIIALMGLYFCDYYQQKAIVMFGEGSAYFDPSITETENVFEYYFQQPSGFVLRDVPNISVISRVTWANFHLAQQLGDAQYDRSEEFMDTLALIMKKYLRLNDKTQGLVQAELAHRQIPSNTLGVHVRGSDYKNNFYAHPVFVSVEKYIEEIDAAIAAHSFEKIFVATDDDEMLAQLLAHYGEDKLIYAKDAARVSGAQGVHNAALEDARVGQRYQLGLDVLYDMYSLAACDGLLSGLSNVPTVARIYKKSKDELFIFDKTINLGVNKKGKRC